MKIMKFGGTSVGTPQRIKDVTGLVSGRGRNVVVFSAMSGTTNSLVDIDRLAAEGDRDGAVKAIDALEKKYDGAARELLESKAQEVFDTELKSVFNLLRDQVTAPRTPWTEKVILAQGELLSSILIYNYMKGEGINVVKLPALEFMRLDANGEPDSDAIAYGLKHQLEANPAADLYITQGFICRDAMGHIDNLQRGGSDYTASLIGAALEADEIEIWTDIDGMHNNDPRYVEGTKPVHLLDFEEASELAYFGAKILHPTCVLPAKLKNIPVRLLNTMEPEAEGTLIHNAPATHTIKAVAAKDNITAIKIKSGRMLLAYGFLRKVFEVFEHHRTPIDMITTSEVGVSVTIDNESKLDAIVAELELLGDVTVDRDMVIICVVGDMDWRNRGFEAAVVQAMSSIPVRMISYGGSNYNISLLVGKDDKIRSLQCLSAALF